MAFSFPPHSNYNLLREYKFTEPIKNEVSLSLELWKFMYTLRRHEEALIDEYHPKDEMKCPIHFCIGQEALPAALNLLIQDNDYLFSNHRSHGYYFAKKCSIEKFYKELFGKAGGINKGRAGSQEISSTDNKFFSGAILTGTTSIAVGVAHGLKLSKSNNVSVSVCGDGATDEGAFWEAINFSAVNNLPILFLIENNNFATFKPYSERFKKYNIAEKAERFGLESEIVFGNDSLNLYRNLSKKIENIRNGKGPILVETITYRMNGHVGPDTDEFNGYRSTADIDFWAKLCPLKNIQKILIEKGILDKNVIAEFDHKIESEIKLLFTAARDDSWPDPKEILTHYPNTTPNDTGERLDFSPILKVQETIPGPY